MINKTFNFLGHDFMKRLMAEVLTDEKFADNIIDILEPRFFEGCEPLPQMVQILKTAHEQDEVICNYETLRIRFLSSKAAESKIQRTLFLTTLSSIEELPLNDGYNIQKTGMSFCKRQAMRIMNEKALHIIETEGEESYYKCEDLMRKALELGDSKIDDINVFDNLDDVLADDFRNPIATGIQLLDEVMNGGLSRTELAILLAPLGVGKTTVTTKIANTAFNNNKKVVQMFFEDNPKVIKRKHLACWSEGKFSLNELSANKEEVKKIANEKMNASTGYLKLKKFPSLGTTPRDIKIYLRKLIARGERPDLIIIDYVDCMSPTSKVDDINVGEGNIMREIEMMLEEFNIAGWVATQGNRSSISSEVVDTNQMGGSLKKAQIGHFLLSIAKTMTQKETNLATFAVLKSRFGRDGLVFPDSIMNNGTLEIEFKADDNLEGLTHSEMVGRKQEAAQARVNVLMSEKFAEVKKSIENGVKNA